MKNQKVNKSALARDLGVSRSSLYYTSKMDLKDNILKDQILSTLQDHPAYGHRRIALHLNRNKKCILRVMKKFSIQPIIKRSKRPFKPDDIGNTELGYCNYLKCLTPIIPSVFWANDFTYIWFNGRFYYLATVIDIVSREIVGIAISQFHNAELIIKALNNALTKHPSPQYIHSDQGSEYDSSTYRSFTKTHGITISMASKGKPWQNGFQESFYSQFKLELGNVNRFNTLGELVEAIHLQIHYYNYKRIHTSLKMPPKSFASLYSSN